MSDDELSVRVRLASFGEADALKQVLDEEEIPYRERPYLDTAFDGIGLAMHQQIGWGELWVRAADEARVTEALAAIRAAPEAAPGAEPEEPEPPAEEHEERGRPNLRGLWLLIAVVLGVVAVVVASAIWGGSRCDRLADPAEREKCEQQLERERAKVQPPRDWR